MIAEGRFPFPRRRSELISSPRVGDGILRLDRAGIVTYASPNALSAYRRLGLTADLVGAHLGRATATLAPQLEATEEAVTAVASGRAPRETEVENRDGILQLRAIPLVPGGQRIGALVLLRDVTELRRRDRELLSKDATIREIHHRVKNNLQTVAALLRLQARRSDMPSARAALDEAVRRVGSIALVHETLSQTIDEQVEFDAVADRLLATVADVSSPFAGGGDGFSDGPVVFRRIGSFGTLPAGPATSLAMVLTELLQNAVEHGLKHGAGRLDVTAVRSNADGPADNSFNSSGQLRVVVEDDGVGLPAGFDAATSGNLGLQIVGTLVVTELGGELTIRPRPGGGTKVTLTLPLRDQQPSG
jgi:two-component system, sensor histidine kinase PdtaS